MGFENFNESSRVVPLHGGSGKAKPTVAIDFSVLTAELENLRGIRRVLIETREGVIKTIHVESDLSRRAKSISADIQSKLAFLGIPLDYKKISIIEPKETGLLSPTPAPVIVRAQPRVILKQVGVTEDESGTVSSFCVLRFESRQITGTFSAPGVPVEQAAAMSALNAFRNIIAPHSLELDTVKVDVALNTVGIILSFSLSGSDQQEFLTGMVKIYDHDVPRATAKAFLAATNRRVELLFA